MCHNRRCPIFDSCEQDIEQTLYCRHVEMIKRIAETRIRLQQRGLVRQRLAAQRSVSVPAAANE